MCWFLMKYTFLAGAPYWRIEQFVEENEGKKIIIATSDIKQLKPVQELTNTKDHAEHTNDIINGIVENNINLKIRKGLHTQEDRDKLINIKNDIFEKKLSAKKIIEKYISYTDSITSSPINIAFFYTILVKMYPMESGS